MPRHGAELGHPGKDAGTQVWLSVQQRAADKRGLGRRQVDTQRWTVSKTLGATQQQQQVTDREAETGGHLESQLWSLCAGVGVGRDRKVSQTQEGGTKLSEAPAHIPKGEAGSGSYVLHRAPPPDTS